MPVADMYYHMPADKLPKLELMDVSESYNQAPGSIYIHLKYAGFCLHEREMNGHDDSDFFMVVWDAEKQEPFEECFGSTRGWTYPTMDHSRPDATPEVKAAYTAFLERVSEERRARREAEEAKRPAKDRTCRVIKGRKVPVGTTGKVFWIGETKFGVRAGLIDATGTKHFTALTNLEAVVA